MKNLFFLSLSLVAFLACQSRFDERTILSLNGTWDIAKTPGFEDIPGSFSETIQVPGMVDMVFNEKKSEKPFEKGVYWHRTQVTVGQRIPQVAKLKIFKSKYFTKVYVNGKFAGQNPYCFTPTELDVTDYLKGNNETNEILIGVGCMPDMPDTVMWGHDFEKDYYIPGIYDRVELMLANYPYIDEIQTVPDIENEYLRVVAKIDLGPYKSSSNLFYEIRELQTGQSISRGKYKLLNNNAIADFKIPMEGCTLWTPDEPFLYTLDLSTGNDHETVRFGMRSFRFDPNTKLALLNGKPYYMRGTNVCFFRFAEDDERQNYPWQDEWVTRLHQQFKSMHWNSMRYCIGLPPERWYDIADSLGFLIQNEYPLWTGTNLYDTLYREVTADRLAAEYRAWMPEHWNRPSVVIWDAQNESVTEVIGKAIGGGSRFCWRWFDAHVFSGQWLLYFGF